MEKAYKGRCFIAPWKVKWKDHFNVILTDPDGDGNVVLVNFTNAAGCPDHTVVCVMGEHPYFIKEASAVSYADVVIAPAELIEVLNSWKDYGFHPTDIDGDLLRRLQRGLLKSAFTPNGIKDYCAAKFDCD